MAQTYTLYAAGVTWAANKNMIAIVNHTGSGRVLRLFRLWLINTASATVTGGTCVSKLDRCTSVASFTAGTSLTFLKHDSNSETPPATVLANTGTTTVLTRSGTYRNIMSYNEEIALSSGHPEDLMTLVPWSGVGCWIRKFHHPTDHNERRRRSRAVHPIIRRRHVYRKH